MATEAALAKAKEIAMRLAGKLVSSECYCIINDDHILYIRRY